MAKTAGKCAADLAGDSTVTIAGVEVVQFDDGPKLGITFQGSGRRLVCNVTKEDEVRAAVQSLYGEFFAS